MVESKMLLIAIGRLIKARSEGCGDKVPYMQIYKDVQAIANAEGVILEPFEKEGGEE